jgi:hypothetical protein
LLHGTSSGTARPYQAYDAELGQPKPKSPEQALALASKDSGAVPLAERLPAMPFLRETMFLHKLANPRCVDVTAANSRAFKAS